MMLSSAKKDNWNPTSSRKDLGFTKSIKTAANTKALVNLFSRPKKTASIAAKAITPARTADAGRPISVKYAAKAAAEHINAQRRDKPAAI